MRELSSMAKEDEAVNISDLEKYEEKPHKFLQVSDEKAMVTKAPVTRTSMGLGTTAKKDKTKNQDEDQTQIQPEEQDKQDNRL